MFESVKPRRRSPFAAVISLVLHAMVLSGVTWLAYAQAASPAIRQSRLSYMPVALPERLEPIPIARLEMPKLEARRESEADTLVAPPAALEPPKPEPKPEPPPAPSPSPPSSKPPSAPTRVVQVGGFAAAPSAVAQVEPRQVQTAAFEAQQAIAPAMKARVADVGAFEAHDGKAARPGTDRPAGPVVSVGFESANAPSTIVRSTRAVSSPGFGAAAQRPASTAQKSEVKAVSFADRPSPQTTAAAKPKVDPTFTPVEVLFKPTPAYSEEARSLRIEGEVTLEVDFGATGLVRVVRVVRGLGHGLDDLAARAAEQIRFKPAQSGGRPVDFRANVQIVFRLT